MAYPKRPDEQDNPVCPVCRQELGWMDEIETDHGTDHVSGCSRCKDRHNAYEWFAGEKPHSYWAV